MKNTLAILAVAAAFALPSCSNQGPNTNSGMATGALLGAGTGAIIGNQSGHAGQGALIGAGAGTLIGGAYGKSKDQQEGY
ncbi:MAG: glycine zipper family protein [Verrucomicrobiota bacterium]